MKVYRLIILSTHPIQYNAPVFKLLQTTDNLELQVIYTQPPEDTEYDKSFGQVVKWDIPVLEGYNYIFKKPGARNIIRYIESWKPDAILIFGWSPPGHLNLMRYFKDKVPIWFRGDSTLLGEIPGPKQWMRRMGLKWVYRHVDKAFFVGYHNKQYFLKHGLKENQLHFAPHAIDNDRFAESTLNYELEAHTWRESLGISKDDYVVLFVGKLEPIKNPVLLVKAIQEINKTNPTPFFLIFVGSGVLESQLIEASSGDDKIKFLGFQNQTKMPIVYRLANVVCLPSFSETWGLSINEALACGRPVVVSDKVGCAPDLVSKQNFSHVFPSNDLPALIKALLLAYQQKDVVQSSAGIKQIAKTIEPWSFSTITSAIENAFIHHEERS